MRSIVLVTGAASLIGSHVAAYLLKQGHAVVGLGDLSGGFEDHVPPQIKNLEARNEVVHAYSAHEKVQKYFGESDQECLV
jgi:nucleoside-diphosphate-sugar epimerase